MTMAWVAVGTAVVGAGASIYSSNKASKAQQKAVDKASKTTESATSESIAANKEALDKIIALNEPFRQLGIANITKLQEKINKGYPTFDEFVASPEAAKIRAAELDDMRDITESSAAAKGNLFSPATQQQLQKDALRQSDYTKYSQYKDSLTKEDAEINNLFNAVNVGRGASTTQSSAVENSSNSVANLLTSNAATQGNLAVLAGDSRASNYVNQGNILNNLANTMGTFALYKNQGIIK